MRFLLTGGAGFVGGFLAQRLAAEGHEVVLFDEVERPLPDGSGDALSFVRGDVCREGDVAPVLDGADVVVHLAARHRFFGVTEEEFFKVNVGGTKTLLAGMERSGTRRLVFYSSVAVYGDLDGPSGEEKACRPVNPYGRSKLEAEGAISEWARQSPDRAALIIRPTVIYGPRNRGNIFRLTRQIRRRLFYPVGPGDNIKSILYVENCVNATMFLLDHMRPGCETFNVADEPHLAFRDVCARIYRGLGRRPPRSHIPLGAAAAVLAPVDWAAKRAGVTFPLLAAAEKMNRSTHHPALALARRGYRQAFSTEEGLRRTISWIEELSRGAVRSTGLETTGE